MSVVHAYRMALRLLPTALQRKHGAAMETLFARELEHARTRGHWHTARAGLSGVWDVVKRALYEQTRHTPQELETNLRAHRGDLPMPLPTPQQLVRRHATSFAYAFGGLTSLLLVQYAMQKIPALSAKDASTATIAYAMLLAVPFTAAMTIPMAVFMAVLHEFTRLGAQGALDTARRERDGVRRLVVPVLAAAAGVAAFAFVVTAEIVPRTNQRLAAVMLGEPTGPNDRAMTIGELRQAARSIGPALESSRRIRVASYEVEVQKKFALPAACMVLALVGIVLAFRIPRGGSRLLVGASLVVFSAYYAVLITAESLAERLVVSPFVAMWSANALLLTVALVAVWRRRASVGPSERGQQLIGG